MQNQPNQKPPSRKSLAWKEIKESGNPRNLTWRTPLSEMLQDLNEGPLLRVRSEFPQSRARMIPESKQSKSELWKALKLAGNPRNLTWQSSKRMMNFEMYAIERSDERGSMIITGKEKGVDNLGQYVPALQKIIRGMEPGSVIQVNGQQFQVGKKSTNKLIQQIFLASAYNEDNEIQGLWVDDFQDEFEQEEFNQNYEQAYRFGATNCLLSPIQQQIQSCIEASDSESYKRKLLTIKNKMLSMESQFERQGATADLIQQLANITRSKITVHEVITQTKRVFKAPSVQRMFKFKFQNVSLNHVSLWSGKNEKIQIEQERMTELLQDLRKSGATFKYKLIKNQIVQVNTGLSTFELSQYSMLRSAENEINEQTADLELRLRRTIYDQTTNSYVNSTELDFLMNSLSHSGCIMLNGKVKNANLLKHIDMVSGYSQFQSLPACLNLGFPYITEFRKCNLETALTYNGIYKVFIWGLIPAHIEAIYPEGHHIIIAPIIRYLIQNGVNVKVSGGMYGKFCKRIKLSPAAYNKHCERKAYFTAFSKYGICQEEYSQTFECHDRELAKIIYKNAQTPLQKTPITRVDDYTYMMLMTKEQKEHVKTRAHVYSFVLQYQQLNLMLQLQKMDMSRVQMICGDDIYYRPHAFQMMPIFREKGQNNYQILTQVADPRCKFLRVPHLTGENDRYQFGKAESKIDQYTLLQGPGGFGKTYQTLSDNGILNVTYLTLTNKLVTEQKNSPFKPKCYTKDAFVAKVQQHKARGTNFVIDEISLCGLGIIEFIKREMPYARIYVLGDDLQIRGDLIAGDPFDKSHYDRVIREHNFTTDYRASGCKRLQTLKKQIREAMREGLGEREIFNGLVIPNSNNVSMSEFVQNYNVTKLVATCSNTQKNKWTSLLPGDKYRVCKSFRLGEKFYCTGDILYELPVGYDYERDQTLKCPRIQRQHAYTTHSLQGSTHDGEMLVLEPIDIEMFRGFCYTSVSRLVRLSDLYTLH